MRSFNLAANKSVIRQNAMNRCCRCRHEWLDRPFGYAVRDACPKCASVYWRWLDYEDRTDR